MSTSLGSLRANAMFLRCSTSRFHAHPASSPYSSQRGNLPGPSRDVVCLPLLSAEAYLVQIILDIGGVFVVFDLGKIGADGGGVKGLPGLNIV